jgi:hypothetical protein
MKSINFLSESFKRVVALCDLPNVVIRVCDKDFFINQSILPFISQKLKNYFFEFEEPFIISITEDDKSNSLFKSVTSESLIEICSIFISLIETGNLSLISTLHVPSLILFSKKIFSPNFLSLIIAFSRSFNQSNPSSLWFSSDLSLILFNSIFNSEENDEHENENEFSFKVCSKLFKCSSISAAIFSKKAFEIQKNENEFCFEIECPPHLNQSTFESEFENVFKFLFGFPLSLNNENIEIFLSISCQLENSILFNYCIEFIDKMDLSNNERILIILSNSELLCNKFDISSIVSKISENFENISFESLLNVPPSGISKIVQNENLKLKNEDSLFKFLLAYSDKWDNLSIPLFSNVYFEYLSEENLSKFFERFSNLPLPSSVVESLSFIFKSENRFRHKTRHSCESILNSIHSLSEIRVQFERLKMENSVLRSDNHIEFPCSPEDHNGLFNFLRQKCNGGNPHECGIVKVSASGYSIKKSAICNVLDWDLGIIGYHKDNKKAKERWLDFDLLGRTFILTGMSISTSRNHMPKCWSLLGSDGSDDFELIYESNYDNKFNSENSSDIFLRTQNSKLFKRFRILATNESWEHTNDFFIESIEFYGSLN